MARINLNDIAPPPAEIERNLDRRGPANADNSCLVCGRPVVSDRCAWVETLTNLTLLVDEEAAPSDDSQGCFPVGPECQKKLKSAARSPIRRA